MMNKKLFSAVSVLLTASLLTGCTLDLTEVEKNENNPQAVLSNSTDPDSDNNNGSENGDNNPENNPDINTDINTDIDFSGTSNNGGNFIGIDGKVYFRQYGDYALEDVAYYKYFINYGLGGYGSSICCFDPADPSDISVVSVDDNGQGKLYYNDGFIYSQRYEWNNGTAYPYIYRTDISNGEWENCGRGRILGTSEDGSMLVSSEYDQNIPATSFLIYDLNNIDMDDANYTFTHDGSNMTFIGVDEDALYYLLLDFETNDASVYEYDYKTGDNYLLDYITPPDNIDEYLTFAICLDPSIEDDVLNFNLCYCVGIEDYIQVAYNVSVPVVKKQGESFDGPASTAEYEENLSLSGSSAEFHINYYESLAEYEVLSTKEHGFARGIQNVDNVYGTDYFIIANCFYAPMWNQGQMGTYELLSLDYYYLDENSCPCLFNEDNPTDRDLMVKAWYIGDKKSGPVQLLFQYADINGPEGPFETDNTLYAFDFTEEDFVFEHIPEGGDIYDDYETDGMEYLKEYLNNDIFNPYLDSLPAPDDEFNFVCPDEPDSYEDGTYCFLHIKLDRDGRVNYIRYVVFD